MGSRAHDLSNAGYGLLTERARHIDNMIRDLDPKLSLRRIPEGDPAFHRGMQSDPPKVFGIHEEGTGDLSPWVFTLAEMSIDERLVARVLDGSFKHNGGAKGLYEKMQAFEAAQEASKLKARAEQMAEREDEMLTLGKLSREKNSFTHIINGEKMIIGDTVRPARAQVKHDRQFRK